MKRIIIGMLAVFSLILTGCMDVAMEYRPAAQLSEKYAHSAGDEYLTIYYSLKEAPEGQVLMMSVKNTGNIFMKNISINYDECCQAVVKGEGSYNYKNLGNLKHRASKTMTLNLPKGDIPSVKLSYRFTPVQEDNFMVPESSAGFEHSEPIEGVITLYFDK